LTEIYKFRAKTGTDAFTKMKYTLKSYNKKAKKLTAKWFMSFLLNIKGK